MNSIQYLSKFALDEGCPFEKKLIQLDYNICLYHAILTIYDFLNRIIYIILIMFGQFELALEKVNATLLKLIRILVKNLRCKACKERKYCWFRLHIWCGIKLLNGNKYNTEKSYLIGMIYQFWEIAHIHMYVYVHILPNLL